MSTDDVHHGHRTRDDVDFTFMYAAHEAFRRDLRRLQAAINAGHADSPGTRTGWATFKRQLHVHHTSEDVALWPPLHQRVSRPDEVAVLEAMEAEHGRIDPQLAQVDAALASAESANLAESVDELATALQTHMDHEEEDALPLVESYLGRQGWDAFRKTFIKTQGLTGAAEALPWLLDGASVETHQRILGALPAPLRFIFRAVWRPSYLRRRRWAYSTS